MQAEYYKPSGIFYNRPQFLWILRNVCGSNSWPSDNKDSGYTGGNGRAVSHHAPYEVVKQITAECLARLARCRQDGLMLEYLILTEDCSFTRNDWPSAYSYQKLARYMRISRDDVMFSVNTALKYCIGKRRKLMSYYDYKRYRETERKE